MKEEVNELRVEEATKRFIEEIVRLLNDDIEIEHLRSEIDDLIAFEKKINEVSLNC